MRAYRQAVVGGNFLATRRAAFDQYARRSDMASAIPCAMAVDGMEQADAFGAPEQWQFGWDRRYTRDEYLEQLSTAGVWPQLSPATQKEVLGRVGAAIDLVGGSFTMHYVTVAITAARNGAA